ncbi:hypothetical protein NQ176_g7737 [Zarea fungicola]|uniref:Uncharacterized protein n=1 Tax=Zarea fungicola TaxID=93591 RepID=A0ACC1MXF9_9HYPO|nr:hypothetical protein NQ176_g7737 [Lecanicillium fungicola]
MQFKEKNFGSILTSHEAARVRDEKDASAAELVGQGQAAERNGNTSIVELLGQNGAAYLDGDVGLVALLLGQGDDPDAIGSEYGDGLALHAAAQSSAIEI